MQGLPYGVMQAGLFGGLVGIFVLGFIAQYTLKLLAEIKVRYNEKGEGQRIESYADIGQRAHGVVGSALVNVAIGISQV